MSGFDLIHTHSSDALAQGILKSFFAFTHFLMPLPRSEPVAPNRPRLSGKHGLHSLNSLTIKRLYFDISLFLIYPLSYFSFQPVLHDLCNKGSDMCYPVCGMMHIKERFLLIGKSSPCGGSRFPFSLFEWSITIGLTPYNRK